MNNKIEEILKQYPYIGADIQKAQAELNRYITLQHELKQWTDYPDDVYNQLGAQCLDGMPHGTGVSDQTGNSAVKIANIYITLKDKYQAEIDNYAARVNELMDLKKWLDKAFKSLTEDEQRILYLRYDERWQVWKIMQRLGITERKTFYKIIDTAKDKIKKIMLT